MRASKKADRQRRLRALRQRVTLLNRMIELLEELQSQRSVDSAIELASSEFLEVRGGQPTFSRPKGRLLFLPTPMSTDNK